MTRTLPLLNSRTRKLLVQLPYVPRALALAWEAAPQWTVFWLVALLLQGVLPVATVYLSRTVVDTIVIAARAGSSWHTLKPAVFAGGLIAAVIILTEFLRSVAVYLRTVQAELVHSHISALIHHKSVEVDLAFYDSADFYDHLHRARTEASYRPVALLENTGSLLQNAITFVAMAIILAAFSPWVPVVLLAGTLPALLVALHYTLVLHDWRRRTTEKERRSWYCDWLLTSSGTAVELRLFALGEYFQHAYQRLRESLLKERITLARTQSIAEFTAGALGVAVSGTAMCWMVWRAAHGWASFGDVAVFGQALQQGLRLMRSLLESLGQFYSNVLFLGNLFEFLDLQPAIAEPADPAPFRLREGIRFRDVTFRYPAAARTALDHFNLSIRANSVVALVGGNGAGKSTVLKLLMRLYDPDEGAIEIDGVNIRRLSLEALRSGIAVLLQDPVHYCGTVHENIALGDAVNEPNVARITAAVQGAGAIEIVERLPQGYQQVLGRRFTDGAELSLGEWQRLALARTLYRDSAVIILDEPTSAMDPWAEAEWLRRFRHHCHGKTVVIITHRFSTAMYADTICVLDCGQVVEVGTHTELLARRGRYAAGWAGHSSAAQA